MTILYIFFLTALISFAGSIHIGPVNLMVIRSSLNNNLKSAMWVSVGGCLPEIFYAGIALIFISFLNRHPELLQYFDLGVIPFLMFLGIFYLMKKKNTGNKIETEKNKVSFSKGLALAFLNPQLLPFWFAILIYINSIVMIDTLPSKIAFAFGTAFGAFVLLTLYAFIAFLKKEKINQLIGKLNYDRLMGWTFIALAVFKLI